jgi:hypothetical protein
VTLVRERTAERRRQTSVVIDHQDPPPRVHAGDDGAGRSDER